MVTQTDGCRNRDGDRRGTGAPRTSEAIHVHLTHARALGAG